MVGGMVVLAVGGAAYGAVKLSQKDSQRIEEQTGASVEELTEEELVQAMKDLGIESIDLTDEDKAAVNAEGDQAAEPQPVAAAAPAPAADSAAAGAQPSYLDELDQLAQLRDTGVISDEDFEAKKKQLLGL
jgi:hypothetical protein